MDLRSIINTDTNTAPPARKISKLESPIKQAHLNNYQAQQSPYSVASSSHQEPDQRSRPPQPPPLQAPGPGEILSPGGPQSYRATQSPYQTTPTSSLNSGQYPFPHPANANPGHGFSAPLPQYQPREQTTTITAPITQNHGQPSPSLLTPTTVTTPGSVTGYAQYHRPQSSHSSATPTSARSHTQSFPRDSPHPINTQTNHPSQLHATQHYQSQPGTPLGPPPSVGRPSPVSHREPAVPYPYEHQRSQSSGSFNQMHIAMPSPILATPPPHTSSPATYGPRGSVSRARSYATDEERERSLSVSPKTRLPSQTRSELADNDQGRKRSIITSAKRKFSDNLHDVKPMVPTHDRVQSHHTPSVHTSLDDRNGYARAPNASDQERVLKDPLPNQEQQQTNTTSPTMGTISNSIHAQNESNRFMAQSVPRLNSSSVASSYQLSSTAQPPLDQYTPLSQAFQTSLSTDLPNASVPTPAARQSAMPSAQIALMPARTRRKRQKFDGVPIWAQSYRRHLAGVFKNSISNKRQNNARATPPLALKSAQNNVKANGLPPQPIKEESNGHFMASDDVLLPKAQPLSDKPGPLGPWERNILNMTPSDELTKLIADFLFTEVVARTDIGVAPIGGASGPGAVVEIEAKIGQLIDKNTNDRLRLPVMTESIVSKDDPNIRIVFKSSMTEVQHRASNKFLNEALMSSLPKPNAPTPSNPRIPMTYVHTKEADAFYELTQAAELSLPSSIRAQMTSRHNKAKVRITTDQKTGRELAKIIKVRVADLDVYSPRTPFDWRVSVNLEMRFDGDARDLVEMVEGGRRAPERNKDRMTYRHLAYQIDLTQVTMAESTAQGEKEHELEVELSTAELRKQGDLLQRGLDNGYEDLVRGFVENVRVLTKIRFPFG